MLSGNGSVNLGNGSSLTVNDSTSGITGGTLSLSYQYVGSGGTGRFTHSGGSAGVASLYLGYNAADSGTYSLSGAGTLSTNSEYVGYSGAGSFTQSGGSNSVSYYGFYLGYNSTATATYNLSGGTLYSIDDEYVGYAGSGVFTQSAGTNNVNSAGGQNGTGWGRLWLGVNSGGNGTYNLNGTAQLMTQSERIGLRRHGDRQPVGRDEHALAQRLRPEYVPRL